MASAAVLLAMEATAPAEEDLEVVKETQAALMAVAGAMEVEVTVVVREVGVTEEAKVAEG